MSKWCLLVVLLAAVGCGENGDTKDGVAGSVANGGGGGEGLGGGGAGGEDDSFNFGGIPEGEVDTGWEPSPPDGLDASMTEVPKSPACGSDFGWLSAVRGWVTKPGGEPLEGAKAQLCVHTADARFVCLNPAEADENGVYTVEVDEQNRCLEQVAMRVVYSKEPRATVYCPLDPKIGPAAKIEAPAVLPYLTPALELPPRGDENEPRTVRFEGGVELEVTPALFRSAGARYEHFSGRRIPTDSVGLCGEAKEFDGLVAFYPEAKIRAPGFGVTLTNDTNIPPGTTVELFVLGGLDCQLYGGKRVGEVEWAKYGEGRVSEDGATIVSDEDAGLPCFTWLGYRAKEEVK